MDRKPNPYAPPATSEPAPPTPPPPGYTPTGARVCPFCGTAAPEASCPSCGRDPTAPRTLCARCKHMTPIAEPACCHCGERRASELRWKIPLIIALFVVAIVLSIVLRLF